MIIPLELLGTILLSAALAALALFVLFNNSAASVNKRFALNALSIAGWVISIPSALSATRADHIILLGRVGFAFASAIPFTLIWLFDAFKGSETPRRRAGVLIPACFCVIFIALSLSPSIVAGARPGSPQANFIYGPAHRIFGIYFLLSFLFAVCSLANTIRSSSGLRKLQLRYLLMGILLGGTGAITTNLIIPIVAKTSHYSVLGPYFSLLVVSFSAHAIIRYRLMDIRVVIRQGVVYAFTLLTSASIFVLSLAILKRSTGYQPDSITLPEALLLALLLAIVFQPLRRRIQTSFNSYVYRETYDYQRIIRDASRRLSTLLDLTPLLEYLGALIEHTFKVERVAVYLTNPATDALVIHNQQMGSAWNSTESTSLTISRSSPLIRSFQQHRRTLVREETLRQVPPDGLLAAAAHTLESLGGEIAIPLIPDDDLLGVVVVGSKRSGDPYFADDIELLETLVNQASGAMKNAQLYHEVVLANEYVDNILSTMDSGVVAVNAAGTISLFNPAAERLTGLRKEAVSGHSLDTLPQPLAFPLRNTLETTSPRSPFETSLTRVDSTTVPLVCSTATLRNRDGSMHGALMVFSDLTRLKSLEGEKRRAERLASFGALASGVAHEIKNPLVAIRTFAELLPERYTDVDFREDFSKVVIREISRIDDLVGRLRGIAATTTQHVGAVDIREPIKDTLSLLRAKLERTKTVVHYTCDDVTAFVMVHESQLKQLFLNLLLNAVEAMGGGGEIRIRVSRRQLHDAAWIVAEVSDTGPGIPDSIRSRIFDPFFTTKPQGSGLGLAICRGITDAHRGTIRAEPTEHGRGTKIRVEFPAAIEADRGLQHAFAHT